MTMMIVMMSMALMVIMMTLKGAVLDVVCSPPPFALNCLQHASSGDNKTTCESHAAQSWVTC